MEDREIIDLYFAREESAITQTAAKYGAYCMKVADNILHDIEDDEEAVNDTWLAAWRAMPPQRPNILRLFLAKITRNISLNRYEERTAKKRGGGETAVLIDELAEVLGDRRDDPQEAVTAKALGKEISSFLRELPERDRILFLRRYFYGDAVSAIAEKFDMQPNTVTVRLKRVRAKLEKRLKETGFMEGGLA